MNNKIHFNFYFTELIEIVVNICFPLAFKSTRTMRIGSEKEGGFSKSISKFLNQNPIQIHAPFTTVSIC